MTMTHEEMRRKILELGGTEEDASPRGRYRALFGDVKVPAEWSDAQVLACLDKRIAEQSDRLGKSGGLK